MRITLIAAFVAMVVAPATASANVSTEPAPRVLGYEFIKQSPTAVVLPLTVKVEADSPNIQFELWRKGRNLNIRVQDSSFSVRRTQTGNGLWRIDLKILRVPKLNSQYSICATGRESNPTCPDGFLQSFYAFDPAFSRSLEVRSYGNAISARAAFKVRAPSPAGFHVTAMVQQCINGSWKTLRRLSFKGPLVTGNDWNAKIPPMRIRHKVSNLQQLLHQGTRFRVVFQYRFSAGANDIVKGQFKKQVQE